MQIEACHTETFPAAMAHVDKDTSTPTAIIEQASNPEQLPETPVWHGPLPESPSWLTPLTPIYPPVLPSLASLPSPSYIPNSLSISPTFGPKSIAHAGRPLFPATGKTYPAALNGCNSAFAQGIAVGRIDRNVTSPIKERSGVKVSRRSKYTKKPVDIPESNTSVAPKSISPGSGIKLKISFKKNFERITVIQNGRNNSAATTSNGRKQNVVEVTTEESDFTDSDIEHITVQKNGQNTFEKASTGRKRSADEVIVDDSDYTDSDIDINPVPRKKRALTPILPTVKTEVTLMLPSMKRKDRIVDPSNPKDAALIAAATKAGAEIYDSDLEDLPNAELKGVKRRQLFRNVNWGSAATDFANDGTFSKNPAFTQFVPGRWERQPDGTVADQKCKLLVKLTDLSGEKRIFANPPPADWASQEAITILNKRTVQQIRRNTETRFREVVVPYVLEERRWIVANLQHGKPAGPWDAFVVAFNKQFEGRVVAGSSEPRPARTISSLCKEVERFGARYSKGLVPAMAMAKKV